MRQAIQRLKSKHPGKVIVVESQRRRTLSASELPFKGCYTPDSRGRLCPIVEVKLTFRGDQAVVAAYGPRAQLIRLSTMSKNALPWPL